MSRLPRRRLRRLFAFVSVLVVVSMLGTATNVSPPGSSAQSAADARVASSSDDARQRVHPTLLRSAESAPDSFVMVHTYVEAGTDVSGYMPDGLPRAYVGPSGITTVTGTVRARNLVKMAAADGVLSVEPLRGAYTPAAAPAGDDLNGWSQPGADLQAEMSTAMQGGGKNVQQDVAGEGVQPAGWSDVLATHHSALAWEKGYTGAGVKAMVNDSGIDFAHPDLMGTQAVVTDPESPYAGWPEQFDAYSMFLWARDQMLGESNIADGEGYYADTSTIVTDAEPTYRPLDAEELYQYTLPGTSQSGEYHIGTHPDHSLRPWWFVATGTEMPEVEDPAEYRTNDLGERPAVLVVDEAEAGVYDTVYVDLDFDRDFSDEKPMTKESPIGGADLWGAYDQESGEFTTEPDGFYDISAGMIYWISDGVNPVPASDWFWGLGEAGNGAADAGEPGAGNLVAFAVNDFVSSPAGPHGQQVASNIAAQGQIDGDSYQAVLEDEQPAGVRPSYKPEDAGGMVAAAGRDVKLVSAGDFYLYGGPDAFFFAALGYDGVPGTADDVQIINNSWGSPILHNDGWDVLSRLIDAANRQVNPSLLVVFAAGNGAPGFGTVTSPAPPAGLIVGASTEYGSTGWDSATGSDQITHGDVAPFSARGPGARGDAGVDLVASGAYASGDLPLNQAMSGIHAWGTWGGTSRAAPVAAGNAALVYQAYAETYGAWPGYDVVTSILKSGARDLQADPFLQGAGAVDANRAVDLASGAAGSFVWPSEWNAGSYHGQNAPGFANVLNPGQSSEQQFHVSNPTGESIHLNVADRWLQKIDTWEQEWTSRPVSEEPVTLPDGPPSETEFDWNQPHYLWNVTDQVPENTDTAVFRVNYDRQYFDPGNAYRWQAVNNWQLVAYDWTDVNGDGNLWEDADGDGIVDPGELDEGEYVRFGYSNQRTNASQLTIQQPLDRMHDGVFIALQHNQARADIPQTTMTIGLDFYQQVDAPWLDVGSQGSITVPPGETAAIPATVSVPGDAPVGIYEAALTFSDGYWTSVVPVTVNVTSDRYDVRAGVDPLEEAAAEPDDPSNGYYSNRAVYGGQSWRGTPEVGDWRFYFSDLPEDPQFLDAKMPDGTYYYLASATWGEDLPTDVDMHLMSPVPDQFSEDEPEYFGPYSLGIAASSAFANVGDGVYRPVTSSGINREVLAAPYVPGLNAVALHNVVYNGDAPSEPVELQTGALGVSSSPIEITSSASGPESSRTVEESVISTIPLSSLEVRGFGLSKPDLSEGVSIMQDNPDDPSTASYTETLTLENAGLLDIAVSGQENDDLDLFLLYDANQDGEFDFQSELVGASTTPTAEERITIELPPDGDYMIAVHGWSVPAGESTFDLAVNAVQGDDVQASGTPEGEIRENRTYTFNVDFNTEGLEPGSYTGLIILGPPEGPTAVRVPVQYELTE